MAFGGLLKVLVIKKMKKSHLRCNVEPPRFYGNGFRIWAQQMELFLELLNVSYVLYEPCPSILLGPEASPEEVAQSQTSVQKWMYDDFLCRRTILDHLSYILYYTYSMKKKVATAKEMWDDLKMLADGISVPHRSLVREYIEFQMLEKKPIVEQVQELNHIFLSIHFASRTEADERFHVHVIISKLPKSWNDVAVKLMRENSKKCLSLAMLMDRLSVEEESRKLKKPHYENNCAPPLLMDR